jgi:hypothetical protein
VKVRDNEAQRKQICLSLRLGLDSSSFSTLEVRIGHRPYGYLRVNDLLCTLKGPTGLT